MSMMTRFMQRISSFGIGNQASRQVAAATDMTNAPEGRVAEVPTSYDQAVGQEKWELDRLVAGDDDPWDLKPVELKRGEHGIDNPVIVESLFPVRTISQVYGDDSVDIRYFLLKEGPPQWFDGHFFKLKRVTEHKPLLEHNEV